MLLISTFLLILQIFHPRIKNLWYGCIGIFVQEAICFSAISVYINSTTTICSSRCFCFFNSDKAILKFRLTRQYTALFVVSGSIKKLFSVGYVNSYLFSIFFSIDFKVFLIDFKFEVSPHCLYRDSLTSDNKFYQFLK